MLLSDPINLTHTFLGPGVASAKTLFMRRGSEVYKISGAVFNPILSSEILKALVVIIDVLGTLSTKLRHTACSVPLTALAVIV